MQFEKDEVYHIYNRSINQELMFRNDDNYKYFMQKFDYYLVDKVDVLSYCLMPTHFHLLVRAATDSEIIEKAFKDFFIAYAKAFNNAHSRNGSLFQAKYKKSAVSSNSYYTSVIAYIHLNPVKAGLCSDPKDWKYSSYGAFMNSGTTKVKRDEVLELFSTKEQFVEFHRQYRGDNWTDSNLPD